ncbi:MAG TPA: hypothetical protein VK530_05545 [Candidatus Acidoferrum sp.]|nr:hypothetical protein [Candidatus Acidoferrum sp.]
MKTAIVATFNDRDHAEPILKRLNESGLHAKVRDETRWQKAHLSERLASVKIEVPEMEFEAARERIRDCSPCELEQSVCCPECGSPDVDYPQVTRKFILPSLHSLLYKLRIVEKEFYCNTCQATWSVRERLEPERDELNWPIKDGKLHRTEDMTP